MPVEYTCDSCGTVLYRGKDLKEPYDILTLYHNMCPNCGKKLSRVPIKFKVTKAPKEIDEINPLVNSTRTVKLPTFYDTLGKRFEQLVKTYGEAAILEAVRIMNGYSVKHRYGTFLRIYLDCDFKKVIRFELNTCSCKIMENKGMWRWEEVDFNNTKHSEEFELKRMVEEKLKELERILKMC